MPLLSMFKKWRKENPLHSAVVVANIQEINELLNKDIDLESRDMFGQTPLHCAVNRGSDDNVDVVNMLIKSGVNIEARDQRNKTPTDYAKSAQMIDLFKKSKKKETIYSLFNL